jgi:hypothetical protein
MACECCGKYGDEKEIREYISEFLQSPQISGMELNMIAGLRDTVNSLHEELIGSGKTTVVINDVLNIVSEIDSTKLIEPEIFIGVMSQQEVDRLFSVFCGKIRDNESLKCQTFLASNTFTVNGWKIAFIKIYEADFSTIIGRNPVVLYLHHTVNEYLLRQAIECYDTPNDKLTRMKDFIGEIKARIRNIIGGN